MGKEEKEKIKKLLKDNLTITLHETYNKNLQSILTVEICFDKEIVCKDEMIINK